jgi:hypothetical protein
MLDKNLFVAITGLMQSHFGKQTDEKILALWDSVKFIPDREFKSGCERILKSFHPTSACGFPVPADFFEACGWDSGRRAKDLMDLLSEAVHSVGIYKSVDFGSPELHAAIMRFGGWRAICNWTQDDWNINEGRFMTVLKSALDFGDKGPDHLSGIFEETNGDILGDLKYIMRKEDGGIRIGIGPHPNGTTLKLVQEKTKPQTFDTGRLEERFKMPS